MRARLPFRLSLLAAGTLVAAFLVPAPAGGEDTKPAKLAEPIKKGQRVYTCAHSFHGFVPTIMEDLAKAAGIADHKQAGVSRIGGSRVIQHWDATDAKHNAKAVLKTRKVDVLTLSPIFLPDDGIEKFVALALEQNKDVRVFMQPIWIPFDMTVPTERPAKVDRDAITIGELRKRHEPHFKAMDDHVRALNKKFGKTVLYEVPAAQAIIGLREKIAEKKAPGLKSQNELFADALGHGTAPLRVLVAYTNFAAIYRRSPVGLPVPAALKEAKLGENEEKLNKLLQELAWDAVKEHPLAGVVR